MAHSMHRTFKVAGVSKSLGLVFGWAIVCKVDGEDYVDLQGDHIPEDVMLEAALDFAENSRVAKEMHTGGQRGTVPMLLPITGDVAKALGITTKQTGLVIAMKPDAELLEKFVSGELTEFSLGGTAEVQEST